MLGAFRNRNLLFVMPQPPRSESFDPQPLNRSDLFVTRNEGRYQADLIWQEDNDKRRAHSL